MSGLPQGFNGGGLHKHDEGLEFGRSEVLYYLGERDREREKSGKSSRKYKKVRCEFGSGASHFPSNMQHKVSVVLSSASTAEQQ